MGETSITSCDRCGTEVRFGTNGWHAWKRGVHVQLLGVEGGLQCLSNINWKGDLCPQCAERVSNAVYAAVNAPTTEVWRAE